MKRIMIFLVLYTAPLALAATYSISSSIIGPEFLSEFFFQAIPDPNNGRVNYTDEITARALDLVYPTIDNTFVLKADATTILDPNGPGRNSFRIVSNNNYTTHVVIFDILHMPEGCGTWPAVWETSATLPWPACGEVDILEGVNDQPPNAAALHTSSDCAMPADRNETGTPTGNDCDTLATGGTGCGVQFTEADNYGPSFNGAGGGWYAMERTDSFFNIWFWSRDDPSVPQDVLNGESSIDTDNWGTPSVFYPDDMCDIPSHFSAHNIIIDLTFCGDYAGNSYVYAASGCPSTCVDFVNNNPSAFADAYFEFASVNIYE